MKGGFYKVHYQLMNKALLFIAGLALPLLLWPVEILVPYPHIIEEIAKWGVLAALQSDHSSTQTKHWKSVVIFALAFAASETMLYLMNFWILGSVDSLLERIILTTVMHVTTVSIIYYTSTRGVLPRFGGLAVAIVLHYLFNTQIAILF